MSRPSASRHIEHEARFLVDDPQAHRAVARLRALEDFRLLSRTRERQRNTYFDTRALALRRAGAVLKLRQVGRARELIFKQALGYRGQVARHLEIAARVDASARQQLLTGRLSLEPVVRVQRLIGHRPLVALLTLATDRRRHVLGLGAHRVELAIDRVSVRHGRRVLGSRREVEVENLGASTAVFARAMAALQRRFGSALRPSRISKFDYGWSIAKRQRR